MLKDTQIITNNIKSTSVSVVINDIISQLDIFSIVHACWSAQEPKKLTALMFLFDIVVNSSNDIMTTGSLTSRQYDTYLFIYIIAAFWMFLMNLLAMLT